LPNTATATCSPAGLRRCGSRLSREP
jgi:hypothetical protein